MQHDIEFKPQLELPSEEELASIEASAKPGATMIKPAASGALEFGMSGKEIRALEVQIQHLKVENCKQAKEIQSLQLGNAGLKQQLDAQQIENFDLQQAQNSIRTQLDQVNMIMDAFGFKERVYSELHKQLVAQNAAREDVEEQQQSSAPEKPELPPIVGLDQTLVQEYAVQIQQLRSELNEKNLLMDQLQSTADLLQKQSEEDEKVLTKQAQEIEKYKRNLAKLQKENLQIQAEMRNQTKNGVTGVGRAAAQRHRNTVIGASGLLDDGDDFQHSFKKSFSIAAKQTEVTGGSKRAGASFIGEEFEEKMKQFNERFMESLTVSLTK